MENLYKMENKTKNIHEEVEERLQKAQANKEFKDIGRVADLKKTKAAYRIISFNDLFELEKDEVAAFNTIKKDLVWQPIDVNSERDRGVTSGAAFLKVKIRESVPTKPDNSKQKRQAYVSFLTKLQSDLIECYNVDQIERLAYKYAKLPMNEIIAYVLDASFFNKTDEEKAIIEQAVKKTYKLSLIYGNERLIGKLIEEIFSKRFYNILFKKGDTAYEIYKEAKDKEPITEEKSKSEIDNLLTRKENNLAANNASIDKYKNFTINELKNAMNTQWSLSPSSKQLYKTNIEDFRNWVIKYYERQITRNQAEIENKIQNSKPKSNDWSWFEVKKEKTEKKSFENKLIINKKEPLSYIKRTGGYEIGDVSANELIDKFGYKAVNYGEYVNDAWSKQHTKFYLQAMSDLGEMLNINIKELNQLGELGIVFGGKGHAGHLAAYFPQTKDINLTKANGDGSVAHEYGHYFDNVMIDLAERKAQPRLATEYVKYINDVELASAFNDIISFFHKGNAAITPKLKVKFYAVESESAKYSFRRGFDYVHTVVEIQQTIEETIEKYKELLINDQTYYSTQVRVFGYIIHKFGLESYDLDLTLKTSMFFQKSAYNWFSYCYKQPRKHDINKFDIITSLNKRTPYWTSNAELFARAWETIVLKKLLDKNRRSDYLASSISLEDVNVEGYSNPYPSGLELEYLETLYDKLILVSKKVYNLSDFVPYNTNREDTLVEFETKNKGKIKEEIDVVKTPTKEILEAVTKGETKEIETAIPDNELKNAIETFTMLIELGGTDAEIKEWKEAIGTFIMLNDLDKFEDGGEVKSDNTVELTIYSVTTETDNDTTFLYNGTDYERAKLEFDSANVSDFDNDNGGFVLFRKQTSKYKFIGDLEDGYEISDFPIEDYYNDKEYYELIDEGEYEDLENKDVKHINSSSDSILSDIDNYYQKKYGKYKYNKIVVDNGKDEHDDDYKEYGCIQLRVSDHSENVNNNDKFGKCDYYISVVIADKNKTKSKFLTSMYERRSNEIELSFNSDNNVDEIISSIEEEIEKAKYYVEEKNN